MTWKTFIDPLWLGAILLFSGAALVLIYAVRDQFISYYSSYKRTYFEDVQALLITNFSKQDVNIVYRNNWLLVFVGMVVGLVLGLGPVRTAIICLLIYFIPIILLRRDAVQRRKLFEKQLDEMLVIMSNALKAKPSMLEAIRSAQEAMTAPCAEELSLVLSDVRLGATIDEALERLGARMRSKDLDMILASTAVARKVGSNVAEMLDEIAKTLREVQRLQGVIDTSTAEGKMQGKVMGMLPVFLGGAIYMIEPKMITPLFTTNLGIAILSVIILLELVGVYLMYRVAAINV
ncbi:MAG: type II secretion system F family protein [Myxococcales bacterium]|nr:type II secretion system F family protein [Myxococcales bacterium]